MNLLQILFALISIIVTLILISLLRSNKNQCTAPQAAGAWPLLGHLRLFDSEQMDHRALGDMADKYGPIFTIKLGLDRVLVVSSHEMAKECFTVHDKVLDRPSLTASKLLGYNNAMLAFSPYGSYWREMRKIAIVKLLSNRRVDMLKHVREREVETMVREIYAMWERKGRPKSGAVVDMKPKFSDLAYNISLRMVGGKRYFGDSVGCDEEEVKKCQKAFKDLAYHFGLNLLSDAVPSLGWLDFLGYQKAMKRNAKELDSILEGWLEEHKRRRTMDGQEKEKGQKDFIDALLDILEGSKISGFDADTIIKATCLNLILAGHEATMVALIWVVSLLLNNPQVLKKARDELDSEVGKTRQVYESDIKNLVYLQAVVKETVRLYPPAPIISMRSAMDDFVISQGNYYVPAGTQLMVNAWKIQRDPSVWPDPDCFKPERFLTSHQEVDVRGQNYELVPFGTGRRSCPGISLGLRVLHYALARFLHSFQVSKPSGEDVDMTESNKLVNVKATPLEVLIAPRLHPKLY